MLSIRHGYAGVRAGRLVPGNGAGKERDGGQPRARQYQQVARSGSHAEQQRVRPVTGVTLPLFETVPDGLRYRSDFVSEPEERDLLVQLSALRFGTFEMRGVVARRRVVFFGESYPGTEGPAEPIPDFLQFLRTRVAEWAGREPGDFGMVLINEYRPGAPIGWHRDAPQYDAIAGVSLGSACRMRFRPYVPSGRERPASGRRRATHELALMPRSAYLMSGAARNSFEHSIPPVTSLRYSITMRTFRNRPTAGG